jgi:hypothetical protein
MSETTLNLREQIARIDLAIAESHKFAAEQRKLSAEASKFDRERWLILVAALSAFAGMIAATVTLAKTMGWL